MAFHLCEKNSRRICERIDALARISASAAGVTRVALSKEQMEADALLAGWMKEAGMRVRHDGIGDLVGRMEGQDPAAPVLMIGSHLDSVREGGKYDGVLGVITGLEAIQILHSGGIVPPNPIELVSFCGEEGSRFGALYIGSKAMAGTLREQDLELRDQDGISLREALASVDLPREDYHALRRLPESLLAYLELHIEQGPTLEHHDLSCGTVKGIVGISQFRLTFTGHAGHAGTVPMPLRKDALTGAAECVCAIESLAKEYSPIVATIGQFMVHPCIGNVIPGRVVFSLDARCIDEEKKRDYLHEVFRAVQEIAARRGLSVDVETVQERPPVFCAEPLMHTIDQAIRTVTGNEAMRIESGAGHDAAEIAAIVPMGMIFVRCRNGDSHCPEEYASPADIHAGLQVLVETVSQILKL
jgi:allantoate deiminase